MKHTMELKDVQNLQTNSTDRMKSFKPTCTNWKRWWKRDWVHQELTSAQ